VTTAVYDRLAAAVRAEEPVALATVLPAPGTGAKLLVQPDRPPAGSLGDTDLDRVVARDALGELAAGTTEVRHYGPHGEAREAVVAVFVESFAPPPRMLVFGAVDFTAALVKVAKVLGYRVTTPARCSPPAPGSRRPTRWWSTGPTGCSAGWGRR
jgi:xanthine dehydrogenase accessory factor